jgi:DNA-binding NtrC family response regulator
MTATEGATVLIVDDEPSLANTLAIIFQRAGYVATAVYSGEEALTFIEAQTPSVVVSDVIMPGLDGVAMAKMIRRTHPNCPVLLFSGNADTHDLVEAAKKEGHAFDVLAKPVPPPQMLAKVAALLQQTSSAHS